MRRNQGRNRENGKQREREETKELNRRRKAK